MDAAAFVFGTIGMTFGLVAFSQSIAAAKEVANLKKTLVRAGVIDESSSPSDD